MRKYRNIKFLSLGITIIFFIACQEKIVTPSYLSDDFENVQDLGIIENVQINEASGIVAGIKNKDSFWVHNDGGDKNRIFLVDKNRKGLSGYPRGQIERCFDDYFIRLISGRSPYRKNDYRSIDDYWWHFSFYFLVLNVSNFNSF